jgi:hypothetical protein
MRSLKVFFGKVGVWLYYTLRISAFWSHLYRLLFEFPYRNIQISTYASYEALLEVTSKLIWTADGAKQLWDATSSPQWVEYVAKWRADKHVGDCDEFAVYNAAALNKSLREKKFTGDPDLVGAHMMTVMWVDADGVWGGHNVALLVKDHELNMAYSYMDYDMPSEPRLTVREVVQDILDHYVPGASLIGYAIHSENLFGVQVVV